jgi:uncharacterized repeat protein (TIGR01451 family)
VLTRILRVIVILAFMFSFISFPAQAATPEQIQTSIDNGMAWLAAQQNPDGSWGYSYRVGYTGLAVMEFEHHAIFGLGISPFDPSYAYHTQVEDGLNFIFSTAVHVDGPLDSPWGNPDPDGDGGISLYEYTPIYETSIAMMALGSSNAPDRLVTVSGSYVEGWTYQQVMQDGLDYLAWAQADSGDGEGGWLYEPNTGGDNSVSGWSVLALGYAAAPAPWGFGLTVPAFVRSEMSKWIDYIQNDVDGDNDDGGSGYIDPYYWVNVYKTGNLLYQMAFYGDTVSTPRVQDALDYLARNWNDPSMDPGWKGYPGGWASYLATFGIMKGLSALGITSFGDPTINWYEDFSDAIVAEQNPDGSWNPEQWSDSIMSTTWALLTLEKAVPPSHLVLTPPLATNYCGTNHTLTATLKDIENLPVPGKAITFTVISGPHTGLNGTNMTDDNGSAQWSYSGITPGEDIIVATGDNATSNDAHKTWLGVPVISAAKVVARQIDADGDGVTGPGDTLRYTVVIRNTGNGTATGVHFSDVPCADTTLVTGTVTVDVPGNVESGNSNEDTSVVVDIATILEGGTASISFDVLIKDPCFANQLANQATVTGANFIETASDDPATSPPGDPTVIKIDSTHVQGIGGEVKQVSKLMVIVPFLVMVLPIIAGSVILVLRKRKMS